MSEYIVDVPDEPAKVVRDGWNVRVEWQYKQREEIVRCRDCKDHEEDMCAHWIDEYGNSLLMLTKPTDFCSWAERRA